MARSGNPLLDLSARPVIAHRGASSEAPENTLPAFELAARQGADAFELDVRLTADGAPVVCHDATLDRTTDGCGPVAALSWSALRSVRVNGVDPVCRLEDVLEELPGVRLNVDVKSDHAVGPVLEVLRRTDAWDRVCLASFSERRLARLRAEGGAGLLTSYGPRSALGLRVRSLAPWPPRAVRVVSRRTGPGPLAQLPRRHGRVPVVDSALVRYARRAGIEVHVWTVDTAAEMAELLDLGVDGLVTDRPDVLREVLRGRGCWPG